MRVFSLFSGVGGFEIGINMAYDNIRQSRKSEQLESIRNLPNASRIEQDKQYPSCVGFSEIDKHASAVLKYRFPNVPNYGDITKINWADVPDFDLLVGGSPCQDLSVAGKRRGLGGERSGLFHEYVRALQEKKPQYFIWENVKGALSSNGGRDFAVVLDALAEAGYSLWWQVLNAKDFGVPQNRERVFIVGTRNGSPREVFFEREGAVKAPRQVIGGSQGFRTYDADNGIARTLAALGGGLGAKTGLYISKIDRKRKEYELTATDVATTLTATSYKGIDALNRTGVALLHENKGGNLAVRNSSVALRASASANYQTLTDGIRIRRLTPTECERLMSWPDDWTKYGDYGDGVVKEISDTQRYKMCGNGVVSKVVEEVIKHQIA